MKDRKIFITGVTGFIGSYIARYLIYEGYSKIYCLKREESDVLLLGDTAERIHWLSGELQDFVILDEYVADMDVIIHAAALISFDPADKDLLDEVNTECTAHLVNLALAHQIKKFIFISSIAALGRAEEGAWIDENSVWKESSNNSRYAISKYNAESEVWRGMVEGLNACILNPGIVLGAGKWGQSSTRLFDYVSKGGKFISKGVNAFVDVRDIAVITEKVMSLDIQNERFVIASENLTYAQIFQQIASNLSKPVPNIIVPFWVGEILWRVLKCWAIIFRAKPLITKETFRTSGKQYKYNNLKSISQLAHQYIPIETTIRDTCKCLQDSYAKKKDYGILEF